MPISAYTRQGAREYQQDRFVAGTMLLPDGKAIDTLAVMDGHSENGEVTAEYLADNLRGKVIEYAEQTKRWSRVLKLVTDSLAEDTRSYEGGSTLSVVLVPHDEPTLRAYAAVIGDSPVIIQDSEGELNIGPEHNAMTNPIERANAELRGGVYEKIRGQDYIWNGDHSYALQLTRSLGDAGMGDIIRRDAEIYAVELDPKDSFILVGTDGLFDPAHADTEREARRLARLVVDGNTAEDLVHDALERETYDNVTAVLWRP